MRLTFTVFYSVGLPLMARRSKRCGTYLYLMPFDVRTFEGKLAGFMEDDIVRSAPIFCYGFGFGLDNQVGNKKPASSQSLLSLTFSTAKTPMQTAIVFYWVLVLSFVIFVKTSPLVNLPSPSVLNSASGNNTGPRLPSTTTYLINGTLNMNTV